MSKLIVGLLALMLPSAAAFHPSSRLVSLPSNPYASTDALNTRSGEPSTILFMGKGGGKKKKKSAPSSGKGFGSAIAAEAPVDRFPYAGSIRPGKQSPQKVVVSSEVASDLLPDYALDGRPKKGSNMPLLPWVIEVKKPEEIEKMRASGKLAREILDLAGRAVKPGVTTDEIDNIVHEAILKADAYPCK